MDAANLSYAQIFTALLGGFFFAGVVLAIGCKLLPIAITKRKTAQ